MDPPPSRNNSTYALTTSRQNLADKYTSADWPPPPSPRNNSIYAWTTSRQNLADKYALADGPPPPKRAGMPWILVHQHWQKTILCHHPTTTTTRYTRLRHEISVVTLRWSYRLWYFNDHISTLLISEKSALCDIQTIQTIKRRF